MTTALADYRDWPGVQQVFRVVRRVVIKRTGEVRHETVYGITTTSSLITASSVFSATNTSITDLTIKRDELLSALL